MALLQDMYQDLGYAFRQLRKNPGFAITAVLTVALGIGATTAIFSLIYNVMLKPLPVKNPGELYKIGAESSCCNYSGLENDWMIFSNDLYYHFRDHTKGFESMAAFQSGQTALALRRAGSEHAAESAFGRFVSGNYFSTLGVPVLRGRAITPADDTQSAAPVAVFSYRLWERRFSLDPTVVGSTFLMNGTAVTVVGVTAPEFFGEKVDPDPPEIWLPLNQEAKLVNGMPHMQQPDEHWLDILGRISPGVSTHSIEAQLNVELQQWLRSRGSELSPDDRAEIGKQRTELASASTGVNDVSQNYGKALGLLMGAAGFVLLIVCANVGNLLLVRAMAQRQQTSVRIALGARRAQLMRQALVMSVVLALLGGAAAIGVAYAISNSMLTLAFHGSRYVPIEVTPSLPVLGFALGVALLTGLVFGVAPAWFATNADPAEALRGAGRTTRDHSSVAQRVLVIVQAALSVVLLCAAGLLLRSLGNLQHQEFGFQTNDRYMVGIDPALAGYKPAQTDDLYRKLEARLRQISGVENVALATYTPMGHDNWTSGVFIPGQPNPTADNEWYHASNLHISPDYFKAIGARIKEGRGFTEADDSHTRKVAVVNETFAKRYFKGKSALGQHFGLEPELRTQLEIVGVAEDTKYRDPEKPVPPMYFLPFAQTLQVFKESYKPFEGQSHYAGAVVLHMRGSNATAAEAATRKAFADVDPNLAVTSFFTFAYQVSTNFNRDELLARLCTLFGITALVLASIGLYGVTAYSVQRRTGEIGVRMALGADRGHILRDVLARALRQCGVGLVIGIPLAYAAGRALTSHLYGVSAFDPAIVLLTVAVLAASAAVAALIPARRASSIEPMQALRAE